MRMRRRRLAEIQQAVTEAIVEVPVSVAPDVLAVDPVDGALLTEVSVCGEEAAKDEPAKPKRQKCPVCGGDAFRVLRTWTLEDGTIRRTRLCALCEEWAYASSERPDKPDEN